MRTGRAAVIHGPRQLNVEDVHSFALGKSDVLVKVKACGICHTDVSLYEGIPDARYPLVPGHELIGTIEDVGSFMLNYTDETVLALPLYGCENCPDCRKGKQNICPSVRFVGKTDPGGFAEYAVLTANNIFPIRTTDYRSCVLSDAYSTPYHAIRKADLNEGDTATVFGVGGVGAAAVDILKSFGVKVVAIDKKDTALKLAEAMGADHCLNSSKSQKIYSDIKKLTGDSVQAAFDCAGFAETLSDAFKTVRKGGDVLAIGYSNQKFEIMAGQFMGGEKGIRGIWGCPPSEFRELIKLAEEGAIHPDRLVTAEYSLDDILKAFDDMEQGRITGRAIVRMSP